MMRRTLRLALLNALALAVTAWSEAALAESRVIPSGTELKVRTSEKIDSKTASDGQTFAAVVEQDVVDGSGQTALPKGSDAELVIRKAVSGNLLLDIQSVTAGGQRYLVSTTDLKEKGSRQGIGKNKRTAEMVGGGAALGTVIGAIAGHGKGAAIGAISGAAAGAAAQVLTGGKVVRVPAETVLTFRLNNPLRLEPAS